MDEKRAGDLVRGDSARLCHAPNSQMTIGGGGCEFAIPVEHRTEVSLLNP